MRTAICAMALAAVACAGDPYKLPLPAYDRGQCRELGYSEGYAKGQLWLTYIPVGMNDVVERATQQAIEKAGGNAISEVIVTERYSITVIVISKGIRVRGLVLRCGMQAPESDYERGRREERERYERGGVR